MSIKQFKPEYKSIQVIAKEWFDRVNGNSYFSARLYGDGEEIARLQYQYGYGSQYEYEARDKLVEMGVLPKSETGFTGLWSLCHDNGINLLTDKHEKCLKREMRAWGEE